MFSDGHLETNNIELNNKGVSTTPLAATYIAKEAQKYSET
jgi:hypothetical protein